MEKLKDIFTNGINYPTIDELTSMPEDSYYCYINSVFCEAVANMIDDRSTYMIARYSLEEHYDMCDTIKIDDNDERLKAYFENIKHLEEISNRDWIHTKYGEFCVDDVIVTGRSREGVYYCVWLDRDVSDCCIMKVSKEHYASMEEFNAAVVEFFENAGYKIRPIRKPDGWIRW